MEQSKESRMLSLISSHNEVDNVRTFIFETKTLEWLAGQSQAYVLPQAGVEEKINQHWFTISSAPFEGTIDITTRVSSSPFKQALNAMNPGDQIKVHSLGGSFIWEEIDSDPVVMVAAGIGITPFRSILLQRKALGKSLNATLLYFNRSDGVAFKDELQKLSDEYSEFRMNVVIGESITTERIFELAPGANEQIVFISGPAPMVSTIGSALKEHGVTLKQDRFPGYDETNF